MKQRLIAILEELAMLLLLGSIACWIIYKLWTDFDDTFSIFIWGLSGYLVYGNLYPWLYKGK